MPSLKPLLSDRPIFTDFTNPASFAVDAGSVYLSGHNGEERSEHVEALRGRCPDCTYFDVVEIDDLTINVDGVVARLRSHNDLAEVWGRVGGRVAYLDITGLTHACWAPLVRAGLEAGADLRVIYVEPLKYRRNEIATEGELFDLSVSFGEPKPLPGFLSLAEPEEEQVLFVPLLGFEGQRFSMALNEVEPIAENIIPVIGVPGFQPEFVYFAYHGNRRSLEESGCWPSVRFATANCPFSVCYLLEDLLSERPGGFLKVAPIGTKPHGLGAVLYAIACPGSIEILYDHPIRRVERTIGSARLLVYHVSSFFKDFGEAGSDG